MQHGIYYFQFYKRLFTIDRQVKFLDEQSLAGFGVWLRRRWKSVQSRRLQAAAQMNKLPWKKDYLQAQWIKQLKSQTKPRARQCSHQSSSSSSLTTYCQLQAGRKNKPKGKSTRFSLCKQNSLPLGIVRMVFLARKSLYSKKRKRNLRNDAMFSRKSVS